MKKTLIALAVAGVVAAPAQAEVKISGKLEQALHMNTTKIDNVDAKDAGGAAIDNGTNNSIFRDFRIAFSGSEDLGGGMKAAFDYRLKDGGAGSLAENRGPSLTLSGGFGSVKIGDFSSASYDGESLVDRWTTAGSSETVYGITGQYETVRGIKYSPALGGGLSMAIAIAPGATNSADNNSGLESSVVDYTGLSFGYANGPIAFNLGTDTSANDATDTDTTHTALSATYAVGSDMSVGFGYGSKDTGATTGGKSTAMTLDFVMNMGMNALHVGFGNSTSGVDDGITATAMSLEYVIGLSKSTVAYVGYDSKSTKYEKEGNLTYDESINLNDGDKVATTQISFGMQHSF